MDESKVGSLCSEKEIIKRRRKIHYRKSKGRLVARTPGILNRSVIQKSFSKSLNESLGSGKLVSIQNINGFLHKNRELAKALEECRQQTKNLENQKFNYQMECIEIREKLSIYQNALIKCKCHPENHSNENIKILFRLKDDISQSVRSLEDYLSALTSQKADTSLVRAGCGVDDKKANTSLTPKFSNIGTQVCLDEPVSCTPAPVKSTRNKKLQVSLLKPCICREVSATRAPKSTTVKDLISGSVDSELINTKSLNRGCTATISKGTQCTMKPVKVRSFATQCDIKKQQHSFDTHKTKDRQPLSILKSKNNSCVLDTDQRFNNKNLNEKINIESCVRLTKAPFEIYQDNKGLNEENFTCKKNINKNQRKVTIFSPAKVCYYEPVVGREESHYRGERLRQTAHKNYKEPSLVTKLTYTNPEVDGRYYSASKSRAKRSRKTKQRNNKKATIAIEDIISLVEESFIAGAASVCV